MKFCIQYEMLNCTDLDGVTSILTTMCCMLDEIGCIAKNSEYMKKSQKQRLR